MYFFKVITFCMNKILYCLVNNPLFFKICIFIRYISVNEGHGYCKCQVPVPPETHNLYILAGLWKSVLEILRIQVDLTLKDQPLCLCERGITYCRRGIICAEHAASPI